MKNDEISFSGAIASDQMDGCRETIYFGDLDPISKVTISFTNVKITISNAISSERID